MWLSLCPTQLSGRQGAGQTVDGCRLDALVQSRRDAVVRSHPDAVVQIHPDAAYQNHPDAGCPDSRRLTAYPDMLIHLAPRAAGDRAGCRPGDALARLDQ